MHRIDGPGATVDHKFTEGNPATSVAATTVTDDWLNALQEEVAAVVEDGGGVLDKNNNAQLLAKIKALISAAIPSNVPQGIRGAAANLKLSTTGLSSVVSITADELTVENNSSVFRTLGVVADAAGDSLRDAANKLAAAAGNVSCDTGAIQRGAAATRAAMVLSDLLSLANQRAGDLAKTADQSRIAGQACEREYDYLRTSKGAGYSGAQVGR